MMGSFLTRGLAMVFGYAYPAYECYKTVEKNKPEIEQLRFWCQYWILVAVLTVCERVGDTFISWVPMYSEAKVAFFIYLWYPKTKGTTYVYDSFFRPYLSKHETEIDRNLLELRTRAGDIAVLYWEKAANYGQTRVFEILQYFASQSTSRPRPAQMMRCCNSNRLNHMVIETQNGIKLLTMLQFLRASLFLTPYPTEQQQQQGSGARQPPTTVPTRQPATQQQQSQQPPSRTSSTSSTQQQHESAQEAGSPPAVPASAPPASTLHAQTTVASQPAAKAASQSTETEAEAMQIEPVSSVPNGNASSPPQETVMEEVIRVTRARSRKNWAAANR